MEPSCASASMPCRQNTLQRSSDGSRRVGIQSRASHTCLPARLLDRLWSRLLRFRPGFETTHDLVAFADPLLESCAWKHSTFAELDRGPTARTDPVVNGILARESLD